MYGVSLNVRCLPSCTVFHSMYGVLNYNMFQSMKQDTLRSRAVIRPSLVVALGRGTPIVGGVSAGVVGRRVWGDVRGVRRSVRGMWWSM